MTFLYLFNIIHLDLESESAQDKLTCSFLRGLTIFAILNGHMSSSR